MRGQRVGFIYNKTWKSGIIQCVSAEFPGYYAIFLVKDSAGIYATVTGDVISAL
jgi:hypothetical protein